MYPKKLQKVVDWFSSFPGLGKRSAERIVLYLLARPSSEIKSLAKSLLDMKESIKKCTKCGNYAEGDFCEICLERDRNKKIICVVEEVRDIFSFEKGAKIKPLYHVIGGKLSPINGIGPEMLNLDSLKNRVLKESIEEVIIATSSDMEGEATASYIKELLKETGVKISRIGFGIPYGVSFDIANPATIEKSFQNRKPF